MNDNRDGKRGVEVHLPAYSRIDREAFDFYAFLPDVRAVNVRDRRIGAGHGRKVTTEIADRESFLRVTQYRFQSGGWER